MIIRNPLTCHIVEVYEDQKDSWCWNIKTNEGKIVLRSIQALDSYDNCAMVLNKFFNKNTPYFNQVILDDKKWKAVFKCGAKLIAQSEGYSNKIDCENALNALFADHYKLM